MFSRILTSKSTDSSSIDELRLHIREADAVVIGAGAGLSAAAGYEYSGERFRQIFSDFGEKYGFGDMYTGGFYPYASPEEFWAYWSRYIYINRYTDPPVPVYRNLFELVKDKDYFVLTTNVDHCFQKSGFDKSRLFYTQGDYGLFQCSQPCCNSTYDNGDAVLQMVKSQGFVVSEAGKLVLPDGVRAKMSVPAELVPRCPRCGRPMTMNLRSDDTFVEDEGWHAAAQRYAAFLREHKNADVLFLEAGVGYNTPGIIKYSFWQMTAKWPNAFYACLNSGQAAAPGELDGKAICINGSAEELIEQLLAG